MKNTPKVSPVVLPMLLVFLALLAMGLVAVNEYNDATERYIDTIERNSSIKDEEIVNLEIELKKSKDELYNARQDLRVADWKLEQILINQEAQYYKEMYGIE